MTKDPMFQSLCSTSTWKAPGLMPNTSNLYFHVLQSFILNTNVSKIMCSRASRSTQNINYPCAPDLLTQHKTFHQSCASRSMTNTTSIYIYHQQLAYALYIKQFIMFICSGVFDPIYIKVRHQDNHHNP